MIDHSAIEAIDKLADRYQKAGKTLHLVHLSEECRLLLKTAKHLVEVNVLEDPHYHVAIDKAKARIEESISIIILLNMLFSFFIAPKNLM